MYAINDSLQSMQLHFFVFESIGLIQYRTIFIIPFLDGADLLGISRHFNRRFDTLSKTASNKPLDQDKLEMIK